MADNYTSGLVTIPAEWPAEAKLELWNIFHVLCNEDAPYKGKDESYTDYLLRIAGDDEDAKESIKRCGEALERFCDAMDDDMCRPYELYPDTKEEVAGTYVMTGCIERFSPHVGGVVECVAKHHEVRYPQYKRAMLEVAWYCSALRQGQFDGINLFIDAAGLHRKARQ